ncbi:MAG: tRNA (adenosine(37)-N6)-threonylcarbamoyltransferase complex ATPase subunit type 1 TsaE [Candidatus Colwellbacteria bacterium]|nr:tRNA (adenosine(37)-N6)-threonylcarbamoyltransferase complex ATPase subunit type 1 TsaE [Candidatus Colwellbacteria bacterium]
MNREFKSLSEKDTRKLAEVLAREILNTKPTAGRALVIALTGELGSGKTTFTKALFRSLGVKARVISPTFVFSRRYKLASQAVKLGSEKLRRRRSSPISTAWHFDAYRLSSPKEIKAIGLKEALKQKESLVLVEWADKVKTCLPQGTLWIEFKHGANPNERYLTFNRR